MQYLQAEKAREIARNYVNKINLPQDVEYPVLVERFVVWRSTLKYKGKVTGEVVLDAVTGAIDYGRTTSSELIAKRMSAIEQSEKKQEENRERRLPKISDLPNTIGCGDSEELMAELPDESVDLIFTSPPYYNVRPEYQEYIDYDDYLEKMRRIFRESCRVLHEGRFFVVNISMALIRRPTAKESSKRLAIPFDFHYILSQEDFEFIDDIIWVKPEGAGWVSGRGRNFALNRKPLAYKPVPLNEYILVYRKKSDNLLGWNISKHPDQQAVERSKILDDNYEKTNIWNITPSHCNEHPATFPQELAEKIIRYYSFENDVVLDPFSGIGTTALAAVNLNRRFVMFEQNMDYVEVFQNKMQNYAHKIKMNEIKLIDVPGWKCGMQMRLL